MPCRRKPNLLSPIESPIPGSLVEHLPARWRVWDTLVAASDRNSPRSLVPDRLHVAHQSGCGSTLKEPPKAQHLDQTVHCRAGKTQRQRKSDRNGPPFNYPSIRSPDTWIGSSTDHDAQAANSISILGSRTGSPERFFRQTPQTCFAAHMVCRGCSRRRRQVSMASYVHIRVKTIASSIGWSKDGEGDSRNELLVLMRDSSLLIIGIFSGAAITFFGQVAISSTCCTLEHSIPLTAALMASRTGDSGSP